MVEPNLAIRVFARMHVHLSIDIHSLTWRGSS